MSSFAAIGSALQGRLGTVSYTYRTSGTVTTTGTLGAWDSIALQGTAQPYLVYQFQSSLDMYDFGSTGGKSADYSLRAVSHSEWPSFQAYAIYEQAHNALQDAPLSVTGGTVLRVRRLSEFAYQDTKQFWHVGGVYRLDFVT